jgi:CubicO group peptidase (beta-lactamase class C family)
MSRLKAVALVALLAVPGGTALGQSLPPASRPEEVGFSSARLERIRQRMQADVDDGRIPGAVLLVARRGKIASLQVVGFRERAAGRAMTADAVFRIYSMTKPIVSVAVMALAEEGRIDVGAPAAQYLPEFKDVRVGPERAAPRRPMTVQDLLRHTSGLTYGLFGSSPVDELYRQSDIFKSTSLAQMVSRVAALPLAHQPGEAWEYSVSTDVLGRIVEVVSGQDLDAFIAGRITGPLRMTDTGFFANAASVGRIALPDQPLDFPSPFPTSRPALVSGGGGMVSTAGDYARFCQMLLNGGELDGVRILSPRTVALMTSDHLPPAAERHTAVAVGAGAFGPTPEMGVGFGLGFAVRTHPGLNPLPGSVGTFWWMGIAGTHFWVDPREQLVAVLMVQIPQASHLPIWRQTRTLVYQALVD